MLGLQSDHCCSMTAGEQDKNNSRSTRAKGAQDGTPDMSVEPFHFGERKLFGLYRPATPGVPSRRHLVVVCNAVLHEYFKIQHVARQLSKELADEGFDVLRFDFSGQGNSGGDLAQCHWVDDVRQAVHEGTQIAGALQTSIVGFRAGALMAAATGMSHHSFVAWDPVTDGTAYMEQLRGVHELLLKAHANLPEAASSEVEEDEVLGHKLGNEFVAALQGLHLDWDQVDAGRRCVVISETTIGGFDAQARPSDLDVAEVPFICHWDLPSSRLLYAHDVVAKLVGCLK